MPRPTGVSIDRDDVVDAALAILREGGLEAVSMRSVAARLGVSPFPLYSRIGSKEAMLDAVADRLVSEATPVPGDGEGWVPYAGRWARSLRERLRSVPELGALLGTRREVYAGAADPLVAALRASGVERDGAVRSARLLLWSTVGFVIVEGGTPVPGAARRRGGRTAGGGRPGTGDDDPGEDAGGAETLFARHLGYVLDGLARDLGGARA